MLIFIAIIYAVLLFTVQTILFQKTTKKILHMIPLLIIGLVYFAALLLPFADKVMMELGRNDGYSFYSFVASLVAGINTLGLAADGTVWLIEKV